MGRDRNANARDSAVTRCVEPDRAGSAHRYKFLHDRESREVRARRIVTALSTLGGIELSNARVLDIGCSDGMITSEIANHVAFVVGIDVDADAVRYAAGTRESTESPHYVVGTGTSLPFGDESFDAAVCNHVYEHVTNPYALMREISRILVLGGVCYFAAGHTLQLIEPHHRLPLLSWLPRSVADGWVRALRRGHRYEEKFLPPWRLHALFGDFAATELVSPAMLRAPQRYGFPRIARLPAILRVIIATMARPLAILAPTWIWLLRR
jgi:2-polyprenyl-3-methyl-5-hydroxy-6-metoxy-1,4-benzoquinol methylase